MAKYRRKVTGTDAWQWPRDKDDMPKGAVQYTPTGTPFVVTIHEQPAILLHSDWVIPERDGEHYYPVKDAIFKATYEPV